MKIAVPEWLRKKQEVALPYWAKQVENSRPNALAATFIADPDAFYPEWFALLADKAYPIPEGSGLHHMPDVSRPDQYWLEVAYQCAKLDLQLALNGTELDIRMNKKPVEFNFLDRPHWALKKFPEGQGWKLATNGLQARQHYVRIRGAMPF